MKIFILLIGTAMLFITGCESDEHHHHHDGAYGGAYGGDTYRSYGHGEYYPDNRPYKRPYDRNF